LRLNERAATPPARFALAALALAGAFGLGAPARAAAVEPTQELVRLLAPHQAFARPALDATPIEVVAERRPITEVRTVLPVLAARRGAAGARWLKVMLPGRPNGRVGWIRQRQTVSLSTKWHLVVDTAARQVTAYRGGTPVKSVKAVVGKPSTPTPRGAFFVEESIQLPSYDVGAPFALALSARSNVLQEFEGGPGQTALHGLANVGGVPGTAVSHGCVRLDAGTMRWLVLRIGPGVPVTIR
jgi:lipoprotein-anchoring transpeptidase ErfK/SrfK